MDYRSCLIFPRVGAVRRYTIYPYGRDLLAVEVDHHPGVARKLLGIPGVTFHQDGEREKTFSGTSRRPSG